MIRRMPRGPFSNISSHNIHATEKDMFAFLIIVGVYITFQKWFIGPPLVHRRHTNEYDMILKRGGAHPTATVVSAHAQWRKADTHFVRTHR